MALKLNAFSLDFSEPTFGAWSQPGSSEELRKLRERHGESWFFHLRDGVIYGVPTAAGATSFGEPLELAVAQNLWVLKSRLVDVLPSVFENYEPMRRRPFSILAHNRDIVREVARLLGGTAEKRLRGLQIRPYIELDPRIVEFNEGCTQVVLVMDVGTRWYIHRPVEELAALGVQVPGLVVVRRNPAQGERRVVGRVATLEGHVVRLSESLDDLEEISVNSVWLEGSRESFSKCVSLLLGSDQEQFDRERDRLTGELLSGRGVTNLMAAIGDHLRKRSPIFLTGSLTCNIREEADIPNGPRTVVHLPPVHYCFDAAKSKLAEYAWQGLRQYGPYSRETLDKRSPRFLVACPARLQGRVEQFLRHMQEGIPGIDRGQFPSGFATTFGLRNPRFELCCVEVSPDRNGNPGRSYLATLERFIANSDGSYDAALLVLYDEHERLSAATNPYLNAKAFLLTHGIPTQAVRASRVALPAAQVQWVLPNFCVNLYAKLGGIPWTVAQDLTVNDELVIGLGTAVVGESRFREQQRNVGITTVFRGDGSYLLSNLARECSFEDYPEELRAATTQVLVELKKRNGWQPGDTVRLVFHNAYPMRKVDTGRIMRECATAVANEQHLQFAFVTVTHDHPFLVRDLAQRGTLQRDGPPKGEFAPERGTMVQLGRSTQLLSTSGPRLIKRPGSPLPRPLLVNLHPDSTYMDLHYLTEQVLKFTSLTWRSTLPTGQPVSTQYSYLIASLLGRLGRVPAWSSAVINTKLRFSRWFL